MRTSNVHSGGNLGVPQVSLPAFFRGDPLEGEGDMSPQPRQKKPNARNEMRGSFLHLCEEGPRQPSPLSSRDLF